MRTRSIVSATLLVGATCVAAPATVAAQVPAQPVAAAAPAPVPTPAAIDLLIAAKMAEAGLMGVAGSVFVDGREVWSKGYGHRDYLRTQPFTPTTPMTIASISKTFTGVAMMRLVAEGRLDLDADVNRYLPFRVRNPRFPDIPITLRMIATHTSSITDRWEVYRATYHWGGDAPESLADFITSYFAPDGHRYSADNYTTLAPGQARDYSNIGAGLVGFIVERLTGDRLDAYTRRHILTPLGMRATGWFLRDLPTAELSTQFVERDGWAIPLPRYGGTTYPDGGVRSTVSDLSRFFQALLNHGEYAGVRILPAAQADDMTRFQFGGPPFPEGYGPDEGNSGLFWRTRRNGEFVGHGGNDPGVQTLMLSTVNRRVAVVLFSNTSGVLAVRAFDAIFLALKAYGDSQVR
ncbi:MAG: serine hydrolase domain-containing protein [Gemmatimonadaceae bacterium]|nr:serine hydrolase domain-containing protein [Gemmatimonadaceae bacterium]